MQELLRKIVILSCLELSLKDVQSIITYNWYNIYGYRCNLCKIDILGAMKSFPVIRLMSNMLA